jgi:hypothetical protein
MNKPILKTLRLSPFYIDIIEEIMDEKGLTFSDTLRMIISEYMRHEKEGKNISVLFKSLEEKIKHTEKDEDGPSQYLEAVIDDLNEIRKTIVTILDALTIIGMADPRTKAGIDQLIKKAGEK